MIDNRLCACPCVDVDVEVEVDEVAWFVGGIVKHARRKLML